MSRLFDIVGYTYSADQYGPECIYEACIKRMGLKDFDLFRDTEEKLDRLATHRGIDRENESSFDSGDFPKVIFRDQLEQPGDDAYPERCANCDKELGEN